MNIRPTACVLHSACTRTAFPVNLRQTWQPYIFLNLFFFLAESQTGKILLQPCKLYLVITHFSAYIKLCERKNKVLILTHLKRTPTVFSANVACCMKLKVAVTVSPGLQALAHLPTTNLAHLLRPGFELWLGTETKYDQWSCIGFFFFFLTNVCFGQV